MAITDANWITSTGSSGDVCPMFRKKWHIHSGVAQATLTLTALGVYEAAVNGLRVSEYVLAPGWTAYEQRLQYQTYDISDLLASGENMLTVTVGRGWFSSPMPGWVDSEDKRRRSARPRGLICEIHLIYSDGSEETMVSDTSWEWAESPVRFSEIYDGECYDATFQANKWCPVSLLHWSKDILIPQEGEEIREKERVQAKAILHTPLGETLVDFGQEITGYVELRLTARAGDRIRIQHGEVLDQNGNFYNANYRSAKAEITYICREGAQCWHPRLTYFGFRYLKLVNYPVTPSVEQFTAIAVYSDIQQTGGIQTGLPELNQLFSNILWGQKGNFLDVPTDCPQRDERLGWTGDAQVFAKTASYNYDVERFMRKWLHDLKADQRESGEVGQVIPDYLPEADGSAAWGDAAVIIPWQMYQTYGNSQVLEEQFDSMTAWVDYITGATTTPNLWTGHFHFGDWLGLDAPSGSYEGSSRKDFIASAFYLYSTQLVIRAGKVIGRDVAAYESLLSRQLAAFRSAFPDYRTQTEHILAIHFGIAEKPQETADALAAMIRSDGTQMRTGFVGTPYLPHVLSRYGHAALAYDLLLRKAYPSWLYSVSKGATTIWEHWDGLMENGEFWSPDMNSFNHYAYGSVADWIYEQAAGIQPLEPGFAKALIAPHPDRRLGWLNASIHTRHGLVSSRWSYQEDGRVRYEIKVEMPSEIVIGTRVYHVMPGTYTYWEYSIHGGVHRPYQCGLYRRHRGTEMRS